MVSLRDGDVHACAKLAPPSFIGPFVDADAAEDADWLHGWIVSVLMGLVFEVRANLMMPGSFHASCIIM